MIGDDPRPREHRPNRLAVGLVGVDRDDLDRVLIRPWERAQIALDAPAAATVEHFHDTAAVEVGDHGRELLATAVVCLIKREPAHRAPLPQRETIGAVAKGTRHLVARRVLLRGDLGVRAARAHALEQPLAKAPRNPLAWRQLRVGLGVGPPARPTLEAALAPHEIGLPPRQRQVAHAHPRALLDLERGAPAARAQGGPRDQLDLEVELVANL